MTYHRFTGNKTKWINEITVYIARLTDKSVLPLVQTEDRAGKISGKEFSDSINQATISPSNGVIVFFLEDLQKDSKKVSILKTT